jgi:hypothetical protein
MLPAVGRVGRFSASKQGRGYDQSAIDLFARMTGEVPSWMKDGINTCIVDLKTAGVWALKDTLYVPAVATLEVNARLNWIGNAYNLTPSDPAPAWAALGGYTPNGTSSYMDTGFNPTTAVAPKFARDSAHQFAWHLTAVDASFDFGNTNSRITKPGSASVFTRPNNGSNLSAAGTYATHKGWVRTAADAAALYIAGAQAGSPTTTASAPLTNFNFGIGRTSATEFGSSQFAAGGWGSAITTAMVAAEDAALRRLFRLAGIVA